MKNMAVKKVSRQNVFLEIIDGILSKEMVAGALGKIRVSSLLFMLACVTLSNNSFGQSSEDEQSVRNVVTTFQDEFNDGRYANVNNYTTEDWIHINPIGGITNGREDVLKELLPLHQTFFKGVTMTIESMTVRFLSPTVAIANVVHKMGDYELPQGVKHHDERHRKTYIIVKKKNKWRLALDQNAVIIPQNAPTTKSVSMKDYLFILRMKPLTQDVLLQVAPKWMALIPKWASEGHFVGNATMVNEATLITGKDRIVSDKPLDNKGEIVLDVLHMKAENMEQALELAKQCPTLDVGGSVEVREGLALSGSSN